VEAITSQRKKFSDFVTTDRSFRESVISFVQNSFYSVIIRDWNTVLLPFVNVQNTLSFSDEAYFHLCVAVTQRILNFGPQKSPSHTIVLVIFKVVCMITCWNLH